MSKPKTTYLTGDQVDTLNTWVQDAATKFNTAGPYSELRIFYDGYLTALNNTLNLLSVEPVKEVAKKSRSFKKPLVVVAIIGGVIVYKRYKNGVLFPSQKKETDE